MAELRGIGMKNARRIEDQNMITGDLTLEGKNIGTWAKDSTTNVNYLNLVLEHKNFNVSKFANVLSAQESLSSDPNDKICFIDLLFAMSIAETMYHAKEVPEGSKADLVLTPKTGSFVVIVTQDDLTEDDMKRDVEKTTGKSAENNMFVIEFKSNEDFINNAGFTFADFAM